MVSMVVVGVLVVLAALQLVLDGVGHDGATNGSEHGLEFAALSDFVTQRTTACAAENGGHQALLTVLAGLLLILLLLVVGCWGGIVVGCCLA